MTKPRNDLTQKDVMDALEYNPDTGVFTWLERIGKDSHALRRWNGRFSGKQAGGMCGTGYIGIGLRGRLYQAHRLAWLYVHGRWPIGDIDHINGNRSDNRLSNIREATRSQNNCNRGATSSNTSGYKGVFWKKKNRRWYAQIRVKGRIFHIGYYDDPEVAAQAYDEAAQRYHGEFARCLTDVKVETQEPIS